MAEASPERGRAPTPNLSRRTLLQGVGIAAAAGALGVGISESASASADSPYNYRNGDLPKGNGRLTPLSWTSDHYLWATAAAALELLNGAYRANFGVNIAVTDSYRTLAGQYGCVADPTKAGLCAVPGTSVHGWGLAVDLGGGVNVFGSAQHVWMRANAPRYEWHHPAWARADGKKPEAWHWEFQFNAANPDPGTVVPSYPQPEDSDMKLIQAANRGIALVGPGYYRQLVNNEEVSCALLIAGQPIIGNDREFDVWVALATQGVGV